MTETTIPTIDCPELKTCPFCGAVGEMIASPSPDKPDKRYISCSNDDCRVGPMAMGESEELTVAAWNTRKRVAA